MYFIDKTKFDKQTERMKSQLEKYEAMANATFSRFPDGEISDYDTWKYGNPFTCNHPDFVCEYFHFKNYGPNKDPQNVRCEGSMQLNGLTIFGYHSDHFGMYSVQKKVFIIAGKSVVLSAKQRESFKTHFVPYLELLDVTKVGCVLTGGEKPTILPTLEFFKMIEENAIFL